MNLEPITTTNMIAITAIIGIILTLVSGFYWNYKNHRKDLKKDTLVAVSGALNSQIQLVVMSVSPTATRTDILEVTSKNNFIFGQMFTIANAETSSEVLGLLSEIAANMLELEFLEGPGGLSKKQIMLEAIKYQKILLEKLPKIIGLLKAELKLNTNVFELQTALIAGNDKVNLSVENLLEQSN